MVNESLRNYKKNQEKRTKNYDKNCTRWWKNFINK
jgi:hypothetical protein